MRRPRPATLRQEALWIGAVVLLIFVVYSNTLSGQFVYDDTRQILQNPQVRDSGQLITALTSDVWAFKRGGQESESDYWRPAFITWLIINYRLFGPENPAGWHFLNVSLHAALCALAYLILRRFELSQLTAALVAGLFGVHPVHVESVAWISGSPDILMALGLLASLWWVLDLPEGRRPSRRFWGRLLLATALYLVALLAKEAAILYPALVFTVSYVFSPATVTTRGDRLRQAGRITLPFILATLLYLLARYWVLGQFQAARPWQRPALDVVLTAPSLLAFYLRQALLPLWLGPSYPLRVLSPAGLTVGNFALPLLVVLLLAGWLAWAARRNRLAMLGLLLFLLLLLPAFNVNAFIPEHIVHDRYLYLPLLGLLLAVVATAGAAMAHVGQARPGRAGRGAYALAGLAIVLLAWQTARYNTAWRNDVALWAWGVRSDPTSTFNAYQYGYHLFQAGRLDQAGQVLNKIIAAHPLSGPYYRQQQVLEAHLVRADIARQQNRFSDAESDLRQVLAARPAPLTESEQASYDAQRQRAYERLALLYQGQGEMVESAELLREGRAQLPDYYCTLTTNLAVTLYLAGQKDEALAELEEVRSRVPTEYTPLCRMSLFYLGQLYAELGRPAEARQALQAFLEQSQSFYDSRTAELQAIARQMLGQP
ncbi:MAG: tetratricopeptide repeat protein [Chloroflexi bacterium]|nr:tetratricopeptide repeat protein [Chloroflexota bacterium]MCI0577758.1 tetratricopeptide repeat protein [Chloroflexota bacterium]MCI0644664.1 tetratricopeptide repeat protein [Chloroflexota bacterium]MCI0728048.1 tetratricopeptide repeat protein [Chloroflexota bacterium]